MYCQACSSPNPNDADFCGRCGHKLLVVSGSYTDEDQEAFDDQPGEQYSLDEHLLERVSILEEVLRKTADSIRQALGSLYTLEQKILVNETGLTTLRELLESKRLIDRQEWSELWESRMDRRLLALEKRERFNSLKERIAELYHGEQRQAFGELLQQAEYALIGLDIDGAMEALDEAHRLDPQNFELTFFLGETCFNEGSTEAALSFFTRVLAVKPKHFEALVYSGVLCHQEGQDDRAEELLKRAVGWFPDSFLPAFGLGAIYAGSGSFAQAAVLLEQAVAQEDALPQAQYLLGNCYFEMSRLGPAMSHLEQAVRLDPTLVEAHHLLGLAYLDRGWRKKALASFRVAQRLQPGRLEYQELVLFLGPAAARQSGESSELSEDARRWLRRAEDALRAGQERQALSAYRRAVGQDPDNPALLVAYAMACLELQRPEEIEPAIERVLDMDAGGRIDAVAYATWIEALRAEGRFREGNRLGERLLAETTSDFGRTVAYFELACNLAEMEEELDRALELARQALHSSPDRLTRFPLAILGWVHFKRGELESAVDCLTRANDLGSSARSLTQLGIVLLAAGDRPAARQALADARALDASRAGLKSTVFDALAVGARLLQDNPRPSDA